MNPDDVQGMRRRREWVSLRAGAYVEAGVLRNLDPAQRHLLLIDATMPNVAPDAVLSHLSAACQLGIDLWQPNLRAVQLTRPGAASGHRRRSLQTFRAPVDDDEIVMLRGHRTTGPARTITDLARSLPFEAAVVAADAALQRKLVTADQLTQAARRSPRRPGMRGAHLVAAFADGRSESVGESKSRVLVHNLGLPKPEPQFKVRAANGHVFARCDFGWPRYRTIGEFDGAEKYGRLLKPDESAGDKIVQEKLREEVIRDLGWKVVRWTWDELDDPQSLARKIIRTLERGRPEAA
jgi:very-short-patch-repair endonuclease